MSVFGQAEALKRHWKDCSDIPFEILKQWDQRFAESGVDKKTNQLVPCIPDNRLKEWLEPYSRLGVIAKEELSQLSARIAAPHFFIVTNTEGIVIHLEGSAKMIHDIHKHGVRLGTSFALEHAGINGISASMQTNSLIVVEGIEHTLNIFRDWSCICLPIYVNHKIVAYLDLSLRTGSDLSFPVVLLERAAYVIAAKLKEVDPHTRRMQMYECFDQFGLTAREKEVAYGWLHNQSALQMSIVMNIAEGTVRNMLKKVYVKTKVSDKGQFMRKFLV